MVHVSTNKIHTTHTVPSLHKNSNTFCIYFTNVNKEHYKTTFLQSSNKMEKLRFEFVIKAGEDPKSNIICITSITNSNGGTFLIPEQLQPAKLHDAVIKTQAFQKVRNTLQKRHDKRQIWISVTPEISDAYLDEGGNMQFKNYFLEETRQETSKQTSTTSISEEALTTILENFTEILKDKSKPHNIRKLTEKFIIDKFTTKTSNPTQWMNIFETECTRLGIEEDIKKIEALRLFLEDACLDWYSSMLIKYTVNSEWLTWKQNFCETYADRGWSPISYTNNTISPCITDGTSLNHRLITDIEAVFLNKIKRGEQDRSMHASPCSHLASGKVSPRERDQIRNTLLQCLGTNVSIR
ncbi:hypothetical protein HW555_001687 [Spodoptera exigua]|uniref:Uncharacterized protein n=1 Tax=Spodoptera exigua TaxID=7107 RepID=A0A835LF37_SPOEX|nr:hypothetical protein HW555_001687 [Spodoptera exigua]